MRKGMTALALIAGLLIIAYFAFGIRGSSCRGALEEAVPELKASLAELKDSAEWVVGPEKMQQIEKHAEELATLLESCCESRQRGVMNEERYQRCVDGAKAFAAKIAEIIKNAQEAETDMQEGRLHAMDDKVTEAQANADAAADFVRGLATAIGGDAAP
jgi:DNA repair ATPase RecN